MAQGSIQCHMHRLNVTKRLLLLCFPKCLVSVASLRINRSLRREHAYHDISMSRAVMRNILDNWRFVQPLKKLASRFFNEDQPLKTKSSTQISPATKRVAKDNVSSPETQSKAEFLSSQPSIESRLYPLNYESAKDSQTEESAAEKSSRWNWQSYIPLAKSQNEAIASPASLPHWKQPSVTSKFEIDTRTRHLVSMVRGASNDTSRLSRVDDLCSHLHKYPQSISLACKEGVVTCLLNVLDESTDDTVCGRVREVLSMVGHVQPPRGRGLRILSIDGGGIRGIVAIEMLRELERLCGRPVHSMFDLICGVSTGALLAFLAGPLCRPLDAIDTMYRQLGGGVFSQSRLRGSANLLWQHGYYDSDAWDGVLQQAVGQELLTQCARLNNAPKVAVVSTLIGVDQPRVYVFRTYNHAYHVQSQYLGSCRYKIWEAVRASAAAPGYFSEFRVDNMLFQDGGLVVNNPAAVALYEARRLWPGESLQCLVSVGTGRFAPAALASSGVTASDTSWQLSPAGATSWITKLLRILDSATDTEGVHAMLRDLLPAHQYFRLNPHLSGSVSLDDSRPATMQQLTADARLYVRKNGYKLGRAATELSRSRSRFQLARDWCKHARIVYGA